MMDWLYQSRRLFRFSLNRFIQFTIFLMVLTVMFPLNGNAAAKLIQVDRGWQFSPGIVSPEQLDVASWTDINGSPEKGIPLHPLAGQVTYRVQLPEIDCKNCMIYFNALERDYKVFADKQLIGRFGNPDDTRAHSVSGNRLDWLELPGRSYSGELLIQLRSERTKIGVVGPVWYGEKYDLMIELIQFRFSEALIVVILFFTGIIVTLVYFPLRRDSAYLFFGLSAINGSLYLASRIPELQVIGEAPYLFEMMEYVGLYMIPFSVWLYVRAVFLQFKKWPWVVIGSVGLFNGYVVARFLSEGIPPHDFLTEGQIIVATAFGLLIGTAVRYAYLKNREAKILSVILSISFSMTLFDVVYAYFGGNHLVFGSWAGLVFIMSQLYLLAQRFNELSKKLAVWNSSLEEQVVERTKQVRLLFEHVSQGFLMVRPDGIIESEYSQACQEFFGQSPSGHRATDLLWANQPAERSLSNDVLHQLFDPAFQGDCTVFCTLLPNEVHLGSRIIRLAYKPIIHPESKKTERLLVVMDDLTNQHKMEQRMLSEEQLMRSIVLVLSRTADFQKLALDYLRFAEEDIPRLSRILQRSDDAINHLSRMIHTFKGNFSQFGFIQLAALMHQYEDYLSRKPDENRLEWIGRIQSLPWAAVFRAEIDRIQQIIPMPWIFKPVREIPVDRDRLVSLRNLMLERIEGETGQQLAAEVEQLYFQSFKSLLEPLSETAEQIALRMEKWIQPLQISGGDFAVDPEQWRSWSHSLIHVIRNQIDHGIEPADIRAACGKPEEGCIRICVELQEQNMLVCFIDDGAGINYVRLREVLVERNVLNPDEANRLEDQELNIYLYKDHVSLAAEVTEWSGRGAGLAAVHEETVKLGGTLTLRSERGNGTELLFSFPVGEGSCFSTRPMQAVS